MTNPLDLRGPQFLLFYVVFAGIVLLALYVFVRGIFGNRADQLPSGQARHLLRDPYLVAFLRGGTNELIRIALFALTERKLLTIEDDTVSTTGQGADAVANSFEKQLLGNCRQRPSVTELLQARPLRILAESYASALERHGLLADKSEWRRRSPAFAAAMIVLLGAAGSKIAVAMWRGHSNVLFLILLGLFSAAACIAIFRIPRSRRGDLALEDLQTLFGALKGRAKRLAARGATNEAIIVAATFGLRALPKALFPSAHRLAESGKQSSSDCGGSGCSSSSSDSGCGGGGGGCGGCGG